MAKTTAESKLLKLIEETDAKDKTSSPAAAATSAVAPEASKILNSVSSVGVSTIAVPPFLQKILTFFIRPAAPKVPMGFQFANQILVVLIFILGIFFIYDFSKGIKESQREVSFPVEQSVADGKEIALPTVEDVVDYISSVSARNIFRPFEKKAEQATVLAPLENQQVKDKLANFKLVGISWLSTPDTATVMIEDKSRGITLFKKTGEDLEGIKVDVIYADRVEFSFQGEKITINL